MSSASASHLGQNGSSAASTQPRRKSHTWSQLKLVIPGGAITYFLGTIQEFSRLLDQTSSSWARTVALVAMAHGAATVALFIYVLLTPWLKGVEPDVRQLPLCRAFDTRALIRCSSRGGENTGSCHG
ncbi:hypothetical protein AX16_002624 [Volvariella volvacea WC 439]|nr:hypothetical protein AX16_002624 [Volvariella volvacea WC 439]